MCDQCILGTNVDGVVDLPVHITHFASRMEQTLLREKKKKNIGPLDLYKSMKKHFKCADSKLEE